uniref:Uncharacterized protein n=1 Tax=Lepeophtheirus salmonis TaxID=72036 RepID=A0A0K2TEP5_LEPSM
MNPSQLWVPRYAASID